jgi:hypothetical protein
MAGKMFMWADLSVGPYQVLWINPVQCQSQDAGRNTSAAGGHYGLACVQARIRKYPCQLLRTFEFAVLEYLHILFSVFVSCKASNF